MSGFQIFFLVVAALAILVGIPVRIAVAQQRRAIATARARLAAARVRRRAEGVAVDAIQLVGASIGRVTRTASCALADDGLYCLSDDGRWGGRIRFAPGKPETGEEVLAAAPCVVKDGAAVAPGVLPAWWERLRAPSPKDGLLLELEGGLTWFVAVPDADEWQVALAPVIPARAPSAPATT